MITLEMNDRLEAVQARWPDLFGEELPFGFDVNWGDLDVLEQCVRERDRRALEAVLARRHAEGVFY